MDYFVPLQWDDSRVVLPVQIIAYKFNFIWPLKENANLLTRILNSTGLCVSLLCYLLTILGELTFVYENSHNIAAIADCLSTSLMGLQYIIRIILLTIRTRHMREIMQKFYCRIYFTNADDVALHKEVKNSTRYVNIFTKIYYVPMVLFVVLYAYDVACIGLASPDKPFIYRSSFRLYDAQVPLPFIITAIYTSWLTFSSVTIWAGEDYTLCLVLCHASFRYKQLRLDLHRLLETARAEVSCGETRFRNQDLHTAFRRRLHDVFRRQQQLNGYVAEAKAYFTHQIFHIIFFGVLLLCVISFQFQRTEMGMQWGKYIAWLISQISQFLLIGYFGQMLMDETNALQNSFYSCLWEDLLRLGDQQSNKLLLRDIQFAIMNSQKPIVFDGMQFFPLNYSTVGAALRSAVSYFMFLNTMNNAN